MKYMTVLEISVFQNQSPIAKICDITKVNCNVNAVSQSVIRLGCKCYTLVLLAHISPHPHSQYDIIRKGMPFHR